MVDWEQGVYAGNIAKCGSGAATAAWGSAKVVTGDTDGTGGFSEGAVIAAETTDAVDNAIQVNIVAASYGR